MRRLLLFFLFLSVSAVSASAQVSAMIQNMWLTHGDKQNGESGMTVHIKLRTVNLKGVQCTMEVMITKPQGCLMETNDRRYADDVGALCPSSCFTPPYVDAIYDDLAQFIPYTAMLFNPGKVSYRCTIYIYRGNKQLCCNSVRFDGTGPSGAQVHTVLKPGWRNKQQASTAQTPSSSQQAVGNFPAGQTRYYVSNDGKLPMSLKFYYDKGYKCATFYNHKWVNGINLNLFGTKEGMNDYGQYHDVPRFGQYYEVYYERMRNYLLSFLSYVMVSSDYSRVTIESDYHYKESYHVVSKQQFDRVYAQAYKALRSSSGGSSGGYSGGSGVMPRPNGKYIPQNRVDKVTCYACHGSGRCPGCKGTGDMGDSYNFHKEKMVRRCSSCSGSGRCLTCHGTGRVVK